jgi:hypothetical protein
MSKKNNGLLSYYLQSQEETDAKDKLNRYWALMSAMGNNQNNPIGQLVHTLVLRSLMKKAQEENSRNKRNSHQLFEDYNDRQFNEQVYLKKMAEQLEERKHARELAKEDRQHARELEKEIRQHANTLKTHVHNKDVDDVFKQKKEARSLIAKSFGDPMDALKYLGDPEKMKNKVKVEDVSGLFHKGIGHVREFFGGDKYKPKKTNLRLKDE